MLIWSTYIRNLGGLYVEMGSYDEGEYIFKRAKAIYFNIFGKDHPGFAQTIAALASVSTELGDYDKAERRYRKALNIRMKILGINHVHVADTLNGN